MNDESTLPGDGGADGDLPPELQRHLDRYDEELRGDRRTPPDEWLREHPELPRSLLPHLWGLHETYSALAPVLPHVAGYETLAVLGCGGMGVVYQARELASGRLVALKMVRAGELATPDEVRRFRLEANEAMRLDHPNIVPVYQVGEHDGLHFFTMKLLEGGSLARQLQGFEIDPKAAARLVATAAQAVHHAHQRQLLHRDLKPANILLDGAGQPHVADFGLAKRLSGTGEASLSLAVGTPEYMAPEQARGQRLTTACDVYGLGGILYTCLAGRPPFRGDSPWAVIEQVLSAEPAPPPSSHRAGVPHDLETICLKALAKDLARRYASAEALAADVHRFLNGEPILARPVGPVERALKWARRRPALAVLAAGLATAVLLFIAISLVLIRGLKDVNAQLENSNAQLAGANTRLDQLYEAEKDAREREQRARLQAEASLELLADDFDEPIGIDGPMFRAPKDAVKGRTVVQLLEHGYERINRRYNLSPEVRAAMLNTIGNAYRNLGMLEQAEQHMREGLDLVKESDSPTPAALYQSLGRLHVERGLLEKNDYEEADRNYHHALTIQETHFQRRPSPESAAAVCQTKYYLAWLAMDLEDYAEARRLFDEVIDRHGREVGRKDRLIALARLGRGEADFEEKGGEAVADKLVVLLPLLELSGALLAVENDADWRQAVRLVRTGLLAREQGLSAKRQGKTAHHHFAEAVKAFQDCDRIIAQRKAADHYYRAIPHFLVAVTLDDDDDRLAAEQAYCNCLERMRKSVGLRHDLVPVVVRRVASLLHKAGKTDDARGWFANVVEATKERYGKCHFKVANAKMAYASFLEEIADWDSLEEQCREALAIYNGARGDKHRQYAKCVRLLEKARQGRAKQ
jgi:tetratricopeptide (TPR) repeat protein